MIAYLEGVLSEKRAERVILDVNGVGYGVLVCASDHGALASGQRVKLYIHEHIREDQHELFGFAAYPTQQLFEQLLTAKGVGPKGALSILSVGNLNEIKAAIARGDTAFIARAPGVGKKVAERIVVDLKDKVGLPSDSDATSFLTAGSVAGSNDEAVQALISLGYSPNDAQAALAQVDPNLPLEDRIKQALKR